MTAKKFFSTGYWKFVSTPVLSNFNYREWNCQKKIIDWLKNSIKNIIDWKVDLKKSLSKASLFKRASSLKQSEKYWQKSIFVQITTSFKVQLKALLFKKAFLKQSENSKWEFSIVNCWYRWFLFNLKTRHFFLPQRNSFDTADFCSVL